MADNFESVFLLWFTHTYENGEDNELLIGVYRTEQDALGAIQRLRDKPGFVANPRGFEISRYELNRDQWTEGYTVD